MLLKDKTDDDVSLRIHDELTDYCMAVLEATYTDPNDFASFCVMMQIDEEQAEQIVNQLTKLFDIGEKQ